MKPTAAIVAFVFAFFVSIPVGLGQPLATPTAEAPGESEAAPESSEAQGVVPLAKGAPAPFLGLLVPENRFVELLEAENRARELATKLAIREQTAKAVEAIYLEKLALASAPLPWYDSPTLNRWVGFGLGLAAASLAIWGSSEITNATR